MAFPIWATALTTQPLDSPIALTLDRPVIAEIHVPVAENYSLELVVSREKLTYAELRNLLGDWTYGIDGKVVASGIRVPIRWSLREKVTSAVATSGEINSFGSSGMSEDLAYRTLGSVQVPRGDYDFEAETLRDVPEFRAVQTRIAMRLNPKFWATREMAVARWGTLGTPFLILPLTVILGVRLLVAAATSFRRRSSV